MAKVTQAQRNAVRTILRNSSKWDASSMKITGSGHVHAKHDADKTNSAVPGLYFVGTVDGMVTADGAIREGY